MSNRFQRQQANSSNARPTVVQEGESSVAPRPWEPTQCYRDKQVAVYRNAPETTNNSQLSRIEFYSHPVTKDHYTLAIVCALAHEFEAIFALFDGGCRTYHAGADDHNIYFVGQFANHHAVLMRPGEVGELDAGMCTQLLRNHFRNIEITLLVGTCGAMPRTPDTDMPIYLGDVIVGFKVWRYLHNAQANQLAGGGVEIRPRNLITERACQRVQQLENSIETLPIRQQIISRSLLYLEYLQRGEYEYKYPGYHKDCLFKSNCVHQHRTGNLSCDCADPRKGSCPQAKKASCKKLKCKRSRVRKGHEEEPKPKIHVGTIASSDLVLKARPEFAAIIEEHNILGVDMEGGGVNRATECIVIKGVVDYADSHKTKDFGKYSAGTAASVAKGFLEVLYPGNICSIVEEPPQTLVTKTQASTVHAFQHISNYQPNRVCENYSRCKCPDTASWILENEKFISWSEGNQSCIWLSGKIGSGKTLLATVAVQHTVEVATKNGAFVAHFFCSHSYNDRLTASDILRSYIKQKVTFFDRIGLSCPIQIISRANEIFAFGLQPSFDEILEIFTTLNKFLHEQGRITIYIVDGLDECKRDEQVKVLKTFRALLLSTFSRVFISGRDTLNVTTFIPESYSIRIEGHVSTRDISTFIDWRIKEKMLERQLTERESVLHEVKKKLLENADLMILWVHLQLEALWDDCSTDADIRKALDNLPRTLRETYERCLSRINKRQSHFAPRILRWVCAAIKPFTIEQLTEALSLNPKTGRIDQDEFLPRQELLNICCNLIITDDNDMVFLAHNSVRIFLEDQKSFSQLFPEGFDIVSSKAELAQLCLLHLASYSLDLAYTPPPQRWFLKLDAFDMIPSMIRNFLPRPKPIAIPLLGPSQQAQSLQHPSFYQFAKESWAPLTRHIKERSSSWEDFQKIAFEPNFSRAWHPWKREQKTLSAHYSALLGWAISNHHLPLLVGFLDSSEVDSKVRRKVLKSPISHESGLLALHLASRSRDRRIFELLLPHCNPKETDSALRTALHHAAETGFVQVLGRLVSCGINVNAKDNQRRTSIHLASYNGHKEAVENLVKLEADLKAQDKDGNTALELAAMNGHDEVILRLFELGIKVGLGKETLLIKPLFRALNNQDKAAVDLLLMGGADIESKDESGQTPLFFAVTHKLRLMQDLLLAHGAQKDDIVEITSDRKVRYRYRATKYIMGGGYKGGGATAGGGDRGGGGGGYEGVKTLLLLDVVIVE